MEKVLAETVKGDWGRSNYLMKEATGDVIVLGSSRAIHHYNVDILSDTLGLSCINAGEDGMGILLMKSRFNQLIKRRVPQMVIYEIHPEYDLFAESDNSKYLKYLRPYVWLDEIYSSVLEVSPNEKWELSSKMYQYNSIFIDIIVQWISRVPVMARESHWSPLNGVFDGKVDSSKITGTFAIDALKEQYLRDLCVSCRNNNILLLFAMSPFYNEDTYTVPPSLEDMIIEYQIPFINHYCDSSFVFNPSLFVDTAHLNERGANLFSSQIASEVKEIMDNKGVLSTN